MATGQIGRLLRRVGLACASGYSLAKNRKLADTPWVARPFINVILGDTQSTKGPTKRFATEREAALFVDKWFISQGREPVNILKPKPDDEKPVKTWTAAQIREMVDDILGPYDEDDGFMFSEKYLRDSLSKILGIDMHGRTVRVYDDE